MTARARWARGRSRKGGVARWRWFGGGVAREVRGERETGIERREWGRALAALPGDAGLRAMGIAERRWRREGMRRRDRGDRARVRGGRGWACLDSGLRLAAAGEVGCEEAGRFGWSGLRGLAGLSLYSFINRELEERKREKKRFRGRIWAGGYFSRTHKNEFDPRK